MAAAREARAAWRVGGGIDTLLPVLGLALVDSLNPSALAATIVLVLAGQDVVRRVLVYVAALYLAYLSIGLLLLTGLSLGRPWGKLAESDAVYATQAVLGTGMLLYGLLAPSTPARPLAGRRPRFRGLWGVFALGLTVSVLEFPTALPYLAALTLISQAGWQPVQYVPLLLLYNAILVAPPLLVLAAARSRRHCPERLQRRREWLIRNARTAFLTLLLVVGLLLLADALYHFRFFGLVPIPA